MSWKDFDINLSKQSDGDVKVMIDEDAIKNSLINIFSTMIGSRRMLPDAFVGIHRILFEPMDDGTANRLGEGLVGAIRKWDSRVIIDNFNIDIDYDNSAYKTTLTYRLKTSEAPAKLDYIFNAI